MIKTGSGTLSLTGSCGAPSVFINAGSVDQPAGAMSISPSGDGNLFVGVNPGDRASYVLGGAARLAAGNEFIGDFGSGTFTQSGGTHSVTSCSLGANAGANGTYNLNGGLLSVARIGAGAGTGSLNLNGGTLQTSASFSIPATSSLSLTIGTGGAIIDTHGFSLTIGAALAGAARDGGLTKIGAGALTLVANNSFTGPTTVSGGTLALAGAGQLSAASCEYVGSAGAGTIVQSGGTNHATSVYLGFHAGSGGTYSQSGGLLAATNCECVGYAARGGFVQSGGTNDSGSRLYLGYSAGVAGSYSLGGSGLLAATSFEFIGTSGSGNFTQSGGVNDAGKLYLGYARGGSGTYALNGGTLACTEVGGGHGAGTLDLNGGLLQAAPQAANPFLSDVTKVYVQRGGANIDANGQQLTISQPLLDAGGGLCKFGGGSLTLTGSETYRGSTQVDAGTLAVDGSLTGPAVVNSGAVLCGTGTLRSVTVAAGGQLEPGVPRGVLDIAGSLTLKTGAELDYQLATPTTSSKILMPTQLLALSGQQFSDFNFTVLSGFGVGTYALVDAGAISGKLGAGTTGQIDGYNAALSIQGNDLLLSVTTATPHPPAPHGPTPPALRLAEFGAMSPSPLLTLPAAVPEPSTFALLAAGRWRRQCSPADECGGNRAISGSLGKGDNILAQERAP